MLTKEVEEFAQLLVQQVRDSAIRSCDSRIKPEAKSIIAKRWHKEIASGNIESCLAALSPDIVDDTLFYLLQAIDQGIIQLSFTSAQGKSINLSEEGLGELGGWFMGSDGWRKSFSQERINDDFSDLA